MDAENRLAKYRRTKPIDKIRIAVSQTGRSDLMSFYLNENILGIRRRLSKDGVQSFPIFIDSEYYDAFTSMQTDAAIEIAMKGVPLVNLENIEWAQIEEVRQDKDFRKKSRNFRLLLADDYSGKDKWYVQDSLAKKLDDYEIACKKHGIDLTISTVRTLLDSKSLLATLGLTATAILLGQPIVAGGTLVAGTSIEVGKIILDIVEKKTAMQFLKDESDISYLFDLKQWCEVILMLF
jgi:hypothetical protein